MKENPYSAITPEILELTELCRSNNSIEAELYTKYNVNRGLRDLNGNGVLTGLTEISEIISSKMIDGQKVSCDGELYYRGVNIEDIVKPCFVLICLDEYCLKSYKESSSKVFSLKLIASGNLPMSSLLKLLNSLIPSLSST